MNDRFKFRVWSKNLEKYIDATEVSFSPDGFLFYDELIFNVSSDRFIIEQCTGLKDKNGNLIYEGDVVKQTQYDFNPAKRRVVTGVIKWHQGQAQFVFEYPDGTGGHNICEIECEIEWGINEIIGNIHENKGE